MQKDPQKIEGKPLRLKNELEKDMEKGVILKIKGSDEKPTYWKPEKVGEKVEGKLIGISDGNFGKVLKIATRKGTVGINVGDFLASIDFVQYADLKLRFTYRGTVGKRGMRVFDVDQVLDKDEVPF